MTQTVVFWILLCSCQVHITKGQYKHNVEHNHQAKFLFRLLIRVISWNDPKHVLFFCLHADLQGRPASGWLWGCTEIFPGPAPKTLQGGRERSAPYGASLQYQGIKIKKSTQNLFQSTCHQCAFVNRFFILSFAIILMPVLVDFYWFEQTHNHKYCIETFILVYALNMNDISDCVVYSEEVCVCVV